jgi:hypothetical protein
MVMRSTDEFILELYTEGCRHWQTALGVVKGKEASLIFSDDPDALRQLNDIVREGGTPLGIITIDNPHTGFAFGIRAIPEHAQDKENLKNVEGLLQQLADEMQSRLKPFLDFPK